MKPAETKTPRPLTASEVAAIYGVDPKTVTRWAAAGQLEWFRTVGGHRRYPAGQFAHLNAQPNGTGDAK